MILGYDKHMLPPRNISYPSLGRLVPHLRENWRVLPCRKQRGTAPRTGYRLVSVSCLEEPNLPGNRWHSASLYVSEPIQLSKSKCVI
jgi:hypothetical protein